MNVPGDITYAAGGATCGICGEAIPKGDDALVLLYGHVTETMGTNDPQVTTYDYAGAYHPTCVAEADDE